jgi:hypothetical protein
MFNNAMSNAFRQNTSNTYISLKYKGQHVSVPVEPSSGQFDVRKLCTLSVCAHHGIPIVYIFTTAKYTNSKPIC